MTDVLHQWWRLAGKLGLNVRAMTWDNRTHYNRPAHVHATLHRGTDFVWVWRAPTDRLQEDGVDYLAVRQPKAFDSTRYVRSTQSTQMAVVRARAHRPDGIWCVDGDVAFTRTRSDGQPPLSLLLAGRRVAAGDYTIVLPYSVSRSMRASVQSMYTQLPWPPEF
jgi:hypothetical protein